MKNISDQIIIREIRKRNHVVFKSLFLDYYEVLTRYAERFVFNTEQSEDIVQTLYIYIWEHADELSIESSLSSYLFRAVRNRCFNYLRDMKVSDKHGLLYMETMLTSANDQAENDPEINTTIKSTMGELPTEMARIVELKYIQQKKVKEIAECLHISENTIKTQLLRAKEKFRTALFNSSPAIRFSKKS